MAPQRLRESTPDNPAEEIRTRYFAVTKDANIDQKTSQHVWMTFETNHEKFSMEGDNPMEWLVPGAYAHAISQKAANQESKIALIKLLKATGLNVPNFYTRLRKWVEVSSLSTSARDLFCNAERYFQVSRTIFERFEQMFTCVFRDPLDADMLNNVFHRAMSLRKKQKVVFPKIVQAVDVYVFAWYLFIRARRAVSVIRDDLVSCYHLVICVLDCICSNIIAMKRLELLNPGCTILPVTEKSASVQEVSAPEKYFSLRPYLCAKFEGINRDCQTLYTNCFLPLMEQLLQEQELTAEGPEFLELMSPDNFEKNLKSLNGVYENLIRVGCAADERVLLVSQDVNAPGVCGDPMNVIDVIDTMKERRKIFPSANRKLELNDFKTPTPVMPSPSLVPTPLTPTSSCSALERREAQESIKSPALQTAVDLVTQLTNLASGRTHLPSPHLKEILMTLNESDVSDEFVRRADVYREKLVAAYIEAYDPSRLAEPYIRQRFMFGQIWYFKLLEDLLVSEKNREPVNIPRIKKLAESEKFQTSLFALSVEMILFSYNCSKMFPWPIEVLDVAPLHFVKVIEPVVLLEQLPKSLIKHLGRIEETIYEQMVWKFDSPIWADIASEDVLSVRDVCWPHHLEDTPSGPGSLGNPTDSGLIRRNGPLMPNLQNRVGLGALTHRQANPMLKAPKNTAVCLFFRKVYVLAGVRLRDICNKLGFDSEIERKFHVFQRMFTLFENAITRHTEILKDRHLDQILLCCAYVVAKLEAPNGLDKSFHVIMHAYRSQAQAESRVYRSVLISNTRGGGNPSEMRRRSQGASTSDQPDSAVSTSADREVRADIITFYNKVFVQVMQDYIAKFSPKKKGQATPGVLLSPVPRVEISRGARRQIHPSAKIWVSPRKHEILPTPPPTNGRVLTFTFGVTGQMDSLLSANTAAVTAAARKVTVPSKRVAAAVESPVAVATKRTKKSASSTPTPVVLSLSSSTAISLANSLPPPLAEPANFPSLAGCMFSSSAISYQDASMPDSL